MVRFAGFTAVIAGLLLCSCLSAQQVPHAIYFKFNEGTGTTTVNEASPGMGTASCTVPAPTSWVPGKFGTALHFAANNSAGINTGWAMNVPNTQDWTMEFWVKGASQSLGYIIGNSVSCDWRVNTSSGNINLTDCTPSYSLPMTPVLDGNWHHVAWVFDGTAKTLTGYRDGVFASQLTNQTSLAITSTPGILMVGVQGISSTPFTGDIDEFRFWLSARTQSEITANMNQELFLGPVATVAATPGTAQLVFANAQGPGGAGLQTGTFTIATNSQSPAPVLTKVDVTASGTGDDSVAFSEVAIYRDHLTLGTQGSYDANDALACAPQTFASDDGVISFSVETSEQAFNVSETRTYFVVTKLAGAALPGHTFNFTVSDITVVAPATGSVPAGATMNGLIIDTPQFVVADGSPASAAPAYLGSSAVCQVFTVGYPNGPDDKPGTITVTGLGTADEAADLVNVQLWYDADNDGAYVAANDTLVDTQMFMQDNGTVVFDMALHPDFQQGQTRRFFVVYSLGVTAGHQETFKSYVSAQGTGSLGGMPSGLPAPGMAGTAGLEVSAGVLIATLNGPTAAVSVDSTTQGPNGDGELLCDVTLSAAPGGSWTVASLTFNAAGTGSHDTAFNDLALYETSGAAWSGPGSATVPAPAATSFSSSAVTYTLSNNAFPAGTERRFFLVGKMNGTATTGQTFNARLESISATPPPNGSPIGIPTMDSAALVIDTPVLTVGNGPNQPAPSTHMAGAPGTYTVAGFHLSALNDVVTITGINLTTAGTGNWASDIDGATGVQVYQDDGDGVYGAADTLLYQGGGAALVTATFTTPLVMAVTSTADLWVRITLNATAGQGVVAAPETFTLSIVSATDVAASTPALLGTPLPSGISIGAIEFEVSSFAPPNDLPAGGKAITMSGKGFVAPLTVKIDGVICPGTAVILGGTQVSGLFVPPGGGTGRPIEVTSGTLPPQVISQTFSYSKVSQVGGTGGDGGSGCAPVGGSGWVFLLATLALAGAVAVRRRAA